MSRRLYDDRRWRTASKLYLIEHPLCVMCADNGRDKAATLTDHIIPHNDDYDLFWDRSNWQGLCAPCHGIKRRQDHGKSIAGATADGIPLDPGHPWNQ